jgi:hypothetical protein
MTGRGERGAAGTAVGGVDRVEGRQALAQQWAAMRAQTGGQVDWIGGNIVSRAGLPVVS